MANVYTNKLHEPAYYPLQADAFLTFTTKARESLRFIKTNELFIVDVENQLSIFEDNIHSLILDYDKLSQQIDRMFDAFFSCGETDKDTFKFFVQTSQFVINYDDFNAGANIPIENVAKDEFLTNLKFVQQVFAVSVLSRMLPISASIDYEISDQISTAINDLKAQYNFINNANVFVNTQNIGVVLVDNLNPLIDQYSQTIEALKSSQNSLPLIQDWPITRESLLPITYRLYGDVDRAEDLALLNAYQSPFDLRKSIKVITDV